MMSFLRAKGQLKAKDLLRVHEVESESSLAEKGWRALATEMKSLRKAKGLLRFLEVVVISSLAVKGLASALGDEEFAEGDGLAASS